MSELVTRNPQLLQSMMQRTENIGADADLDAVGKLFADIGMVVLGGAEAWDFKTKPFLSGVIQRAWAVVEKDSMDPTRENGRLVLDVVDSSGETTRVYANSSLFIKLSQAFGGPLPNCPWKRFESETRYAGPERDSFIARITESASALQMQWVGLMFNGQKVSRNSGNNYNDFQAVLLPGDAVANPALLEAVESAFRVGANHLKKRDEDGSALPDFLDDDI